VVEVEVEAHTPTSELTFSRSDNAERQAAHTEHTDTGPSPCHQWWELLRAVSMLCGGKPSRGRRKRKMEDVEGGGAACCKSEGESTSTSTTAAAPLVRACNRCRETHSACDVYAPSILIFANLISKIN
jgi:hypothetical protein